MTDVDASASLGVSDSKWREIIGTFLARYATIIVTVGLIVAFGLRDHRFLSWNEFSVVAQTAAPLGILATGVTLTLVVLEFDLSFAGNLTLAAVACAELIFHGHSGPFYLFAVLGAVGIATAVGLVNGLAVSRLRMPAFITTLAMSGILTGLAYKWGGFNPILTNNTFPNWSRKVVIGLPTIFLIMAAIVIAGWVFLERTSLGRAFYLVGGNVVAARLRGVNVANVKLIAFVLMGLLAGITGVILASYGGSVQVAQIPANYLLDALTCVFLGSAVLRPGEFHMLGTAVGITLVSILSSGMAFVNVGFEYQSLVKGGVLVLAVGFSRLVRVG
jgi:ribose transport system permease protein